MLYDGEQFANCRLQRRLAAWASRHVCPDFIWKQHQVCEPSERLRSLERNLSRVNVQGACCSGQLASCLDDEDYNLARACLALLPVCCKRQNLSKQLS